MELLMDVMEQEKRRIRRAEKSLRIKELLKNDCELYMIG
jgi:hypothetical protein